jgi:hypothetical protein
MNIEGYGFSGIALLFTTLIIMSFIALRAKRVGKDLAEPELIWAATIVRVRNWTLFAGLLAISGFLMLMDGISYFQPGTPEYTNVDLWTGYLLFGGLILLATAVISGIYSKKDGYNFKQVARNLAHRNNVLAQKVRAKRERMRQRPKRQFMRRRPKRSTRV